MFSLTLFSYKVIPYSFYMNILDLSSVLTVNLKKTVNNKCQFSYFFI